MGIIVDLIIILIIIKTISIVNIFYFYNIWSYMVSGLYYYNEAYTILGVIVICLITLNVWWIIDLISILRGKFKDSEGKYIKIK